MTDGHESAATENTGSAGSENTGGGVAPPEKPATVDRDQWVSRGIEIGKARVLKELGVSSIEELLERTQQEHVAAEPGQQVQAADSKEYKDLAQSFRLMERKYQEAEKKIKMLSAQADQARVEKLKGAAMAAGVGAGMQVESFVKLFGDRVKFDDGQNLEVLSRMPDGSMVGAGQPIEEFLAEVLPSVPFLLAPTQNASGVGSEHRPASPPVERKGFGAAEQVMPRKRS